MLRSSLNASHLDISQALMPAVCAQSRSRSAGEPPLLPTLIDDVFVDERRRLQTETYALIDQAADLRRQLTSLTDQQRRLCVGGEPPAFDVNDDALAWLKALRSEIFRAVSHPDTPLEQAVARTSAKFGASRVTLGASMCDVVMRLDLSLFSPRELRALGLRPQGILTLTGHFAPDYHAAPIPPTLTIEHSAPQGRPQVATSAVTGAKHHFRLGYQMLNILTRHLRQTWHAHPSEQVLPELFALASQRLRTLPQHCVVCDTKIVTAQLRPTTCDTADCIGQAETWGYGFEPQDIIQNPEVADLLLSMTAAAAAARRDAFFKRLPMHFRRTGATDFAAIVSDIDKIPPMKALAQSNDMVEALDGISYTALSTLSWVMVSNQGFLEYLPKHQQYADMGTAHQFRIFGGPIERERAFRALPEQHRNRFAFHGSPFKNWHSILRTGLMVGSEGSLFGFNGARHGSGIYVSNTMATSLQYSHASHAWSNSQLGAMPTCVALCETNGASRLSHVRQNLKDIEVFPRCQRGGLALSVRVSQGHPGPGHQCHQSSAISDSACR